MKFSTPKYQPMGWVMGVSRGIEILRSVKSKPKRIPPNQIAELVILPLLLLIKGIRVLKEMSLNSKQTKLSTLVGRSVKTVIS